MSSNGVIGKIGHADLLFPSNYLKGADLRGQDVVVTIEKIETSHELVMQGGKRDRKPVIHMVGKQKKWVLNKTNVKTIKGMYGGELRDWIGKSVTLFPKEVEASGEMHTAIRVRPTPPKQGQPQPEHDPETGEIFDDDPTEAKAEPGL